MNHKEKLISVLQRHIINDAEVIMLKDILKTELPNDIRVKLDSDLIEVMKINVILKSEEIKLIKKITG